MRRLNVIITPFKGNVCSSDHVLLIQILCLQYTSLCLFHVMRYLSLLRPLLCQVLKASLVGSGAAIVEVLLTSFGAVSVFLLCTWKVIHFEYSL